MNFMLGKSSCYFPLFLLHQPQQSQSTLSEKYLNKLKQPLNQPADSNRNEITK
jgi:hypothetical protein